MIIFGSSAKLLQLNKFDVNIGDKHFKIECSAI